MCAVAAAALGFSSCNETWDDNPVLSTHEGEKTADFLNIPAMQNQSIMLTNANRTGTFKLTCSQPDYGYAAIATYKVQCSLTEDFADFVEIGQSFYNCANINPTNHDVAGALEKLSGVKTENDVPLPYTTLYMRLRSYIAQSEANTQYISNVVSFNKVAADYLAIWVAGTPVNIYIRGGVNDWAANPGPDESTPGPWQFVTGAEENTWVIENCTIGANVSFKVADAAWAPLNLGGNGGENDDSQMIDAGEEYQMTGGDNPGHMRLKKDFTGKVLLRLEAGQYFITFDPAK